MKDENGRPATREMRSADCWERIARAPYGRIVTTAAGEIDIFPVNHGVDRFSIVFRTAPQALQHELSRGGTRSVRRHSVRPGIQRPRSCRILPADF